MTQAGLPSARRVSNGDDARILVDDVLAALDALGRILCEETELMQAGQINAALALAAAKQEKAGRYMRLLESVKANAVALARFSAEGVETMKERHDRFARQVQLNQTVIATVKSVSENLVRSLQSEADASRTLSGYGPCAAMTRKPPATSPLTLSVRL